jgi:hypothetical protein
MFSAKELALIPLVVILKELSELRGDEEKHKIIEILEKIVRNNDKLFNDVGGLLFLQIHYKMKDVIQERYIRRQLRQINDYEDIIKSLMTMFKSLSEEHKRLREKLEDQT